MYHVTNWDTNEIYASVNDTKVGKRLTRNRGHTGKHNSKWYLPVAFLADDNGNVVYNPRFAVGKDDDFAAVPLVHKSDGAPRKCSHGKMASCRYGCN